MTDASWDNGGASAPKKGMPTWAKVLMGCGVAFLLAIGSCVGLAAWGCNAMTSSMEQGEWRQLRQVQVQLQTDEGARALYRANPGLAAAHPSEDAFAETAAAWRPRLEPLPERMPSLMSGRVSYHMESSGGFRKADVGYLNHKGAWLAGRWENGHLMVLEVR